MSDVIHPILDIYYTHRNNHHKAPVSNGGGLVFMRKQQGAFMEFVDHSPETTELAKALVQVQRQMSPAMKDGKNPFTKSNYATLNSVMESCRDALLNNNIWLCQYPVPVEMPNCLGLMTKLTHTESGQWQASLAVVPLPKADPQGMGSAITYSRRYAITAMLGMVTEDDDGEAARRTPKTMPRPACNKRTAHGEKRQTTPEFATQNEAGVSAISNNYPELEGVTFHVVTSQDGRDCIVATGNTQPNRAILSQEGFRWNPQRKFWWKYADVV